MLPHQKPEHSHRKGARPGRGLKFSFPGPPSPHEVQTLSGEPIGPPKGLLFGEQGPPSPI